jgi:hypothetical protein
MEPGEVLEPRMMLAGGGDERDSRRLGVRVVGALVDGTHPVGS